ncbi:hypothetical protein [Streptomyces sp. bgisy100]|uniref:hypothetical protein n=1 Tax=Streptomyces sp. bgisy100 TaxID=3413783 RepID=UPI003D744CBA
MGVYVYEITYWDPAGERMRTFRVHCPRPLWGEGEDIVFLTEDDTQVRVPCEEMRLRLVSRGLPSAAQEPPG